jgi:hypothetical protein
MIRVSVMAKDSFVVQAIASILAEAIAPHMLQLTYLEPRMTYEAIRHPRSVFIDVQEGEFRNETVSVPELIGADNPLLVIIISLKSRNIHLFQSYQLTSPAMEYVVDLVKDISMANLNRKVGDDVSGSALRKTALLPSFQAFVEPLAGNP